MKSYRTVTLQSIHFPEPVATPPNRASDVDGVLVVPCDAEEEVFSRALDKARGEKLVRKAIEGGMSAVEAFAKFGIM